MSCCDIDQPLIVFLNVFFVFFFHGMVEEGVGWWCTHHLNIGPNAGKF